MRRGSHIMARLGVKHGRLALFHEPADGHASAARASAQVLRGGLRRKLLPLGVELLRTRAGIEQGDAFVLVLDNDRTSVACMLGAMELKCAVPLVGKGRIALLDRVVQQTGIRKVVTVDDAEESVHVTIQATDSSPPSPPEWLQEPEIEGKGCVCMLTSGSVGAPKVVPCTWEHMLLQGQSTHEQLFPDRPARLVCGTSITHAFSINTLFTLLTSPMDEQSELCFAPTTEALYELLAQDTNKLTALYGTPGTYTALAEMPPRRLRVDTPYCAGSRLAISLFEKMRDDFGLQIQQNYGSTEMGDIAAWGLHGRSFDCEAAELLGDRSQTHVGALWPGVRATVDERSQVRVSTPWQSLGYVKQRKLHRFEAGTHPTADIGRAEKGADGATSVWLQGRLRPTVTVESEGGELCEFHPQEIERVLVAHPSVTDALVLMQAADAEPSDTPANAAVRARVVVDDHASTTEDELQRWCETNGLTALARKLRVEIVPFLPCSPAGKLMYA